VKAARTSIDVVCISQGIGIAGGGGGNLHRYLPLHLRTPALPPSCSVSCLCPSGFPSAPPGLSCCYCCCPCCCYRCRCHCFCCSCSLCICLPAAPHLLTSCRPVLVANSTRIDLGSPKWKDITDSVNFFVLYSDDAPAFDPPSPQSPTLLPLSRLSPSPVSHRPALAQSFQLLFMIAPICSRPLSFTLVFAHVHAGWHRLTLTVVGIRLPSVVLPVACRF
jgi:hypothetical protein